MSEKLIKVENIKATEFTINFPMPNGYVKPYVWKPARVKRRSILEISEEVYEYIKWNTCTFKEGYLVLAKEEDDEIVVDEVKSDTEELTLYTIDEMTALLNGDIKKLRKALDDADLSVVSDFARVAKEIKLDSKAKTKAIAEKLGHGDNVDFIFEE